MITFEVNDMSCGHCVSSVTMAVKAVDAGAQVQIDLATHRVAIQPARASAADLHDAIQEAGYTPMAIEYAAGITGANAASARGGCCGG